jgi:hypothetical protein
MATHNFFHSHSHYFILEVCNWGLEKTNTERTSIELTI